MILTSSSFSDGQPIPGEFAFCTPDPEHHVCLGSNRNPRLAWSDIPAETRSFVLICHDPDVPSRGDDVNQENRTVPASLPRIDFFHWVLFDLPAGLREIREGEFFQRCHATRQVGTARAPQRTPGNQRLHRLVCRRQ
jgi:phosphatidylethanolamine-binding protein (PEBP) family uncharacterized protein